MKFFVCFSLLLLLPLSVLSSSSSPVSSSSYTTYDPYVPSPEEPVPLVNNDQNVDPLHPEDHVAESVVSHDAQVNVQPERHEPTIAETQKLSEEEGKSLWVGDAGVVRDQAKVYEHLRPDKFVLSSNVDAERDVGLGDHKMRVSNLISEVTKRAVEEDDHIKEWMIRLTHDQQIAMKQLALSVVTRAFDEAKNTEFTSAGLSVLVKQIGIHVREALQKDYDQFHKSNVLERYVHTLPLGHEAPGAHGEIHDPMAASSADAANAILARNAEIASDPLSSNLGRSMPRFAYEGHPSETEEAEENSPAKTDPVFNAKPIEEEPKKGLSPLHRTLGITDDPIPMVKKFGTEAAKKAQEKLQAIQLAKQAEKYRKALEKAQDLQDLAAISAAKTAAAKQSALIHHQAAQASSAVFPGLPQSKVMKAQIKQNARRVSQFYKDQANEYARTVRYWTKQTRAVKKLRRAFIRNYNRFVRRIRKRYSGDGAYKAALVHLTGVVSQALSVPTKNAKF